MSEMTALRAHRRGGPEVLDVEQAPVRQPAVRVRCWSRFTPPPSPSTN